MDPKNTDAITAARPFVINRALERVKPGMFDIDRLLRGKYLSRDKFLDSAARERRDCGVMVGRIARTQAHEQVATTSTRPRSSERP